MPEAHARATRTATAEAGALPPSRPFAPRSGAPTRSTSTGHSFARVAVSSPTDAPIQRFPGTGTYKTGRKAYVRKRKRHSKFPVMEVDHQPARVVSTGTKMTRRQAKRRRLVDNERAFPVIKPSHRRHVTTGSSKRSKKFRKHQRRLLLSSPSPMGRNLVEQLSLLEYAQDPEFKKFATSNTSGSKLQQTGWNEMSHHPSKYVDEQSEVQTIPEDSEYVREMRKLQYQASTTGVWPVEEVKKLNQLHFGQYQEKTVKEEEKD